MDMNNGYSKPKLKIYKKKIEHFVRMRNWIFLLPSLYALPTFFTIVLNFMGPFSGRGGSGLLTFKLIIWPVMPDPSSITISNISTSAEHKPLQNIALIFLFYAKILKYNEWLCRQLCTAPKLNFTCPLYACKKRGN